MDGEETREELFVEHYEFMFATARKVLKQKADAEDVIQALYFKLLESELPPDIWKDPKGYLYRTVVNACHDWRRSRKSRKEQQRVEELEFAEPRSGHAHENATLQVEHVLGNLEGDVVKIVMLHADSGYSDAEIAGMMGESRTKIAKILSRAREKLRKVRGTAGGPDAKDLAWGNRPDAITEVAKQRTDGGVAGGPDAKE
jgi:RNA polymerase sigma factor (sigma-70 family)